MCCEYFPNALYLSDNGIDTIDEYWQYNGSIGSSCSLQICSRTVCRDLPEMGSQSNKSLFI